MFTYSIKWVREMRKFHVTFTQWRLRNLKKGCLLFDCHFANINILLFAVLVAIAIFIAQAHNNCRDAAILVITRHQTSSLYSLALKFINWGWCTGNFGQSPGMSLAIRYLTLIPTSLKAILSQLLLHAQEKKKEMKTDIEKATYLWTKWCVSKI